MSAAIAMIRVGFMWTSVCPALTYAFFAILATSWCQSAGNR